jgi:hypothetical protein
VNNNNGFWIRWLNLLVLRLELQSVRTARNQSWLPRPLFILFLILRLTSILSLSLILRPTVSQPVCLGIKHQSGAYNHFFYYCQTVTSLLICGVLSDDRTGLSFTIAAGPRQRSHSRSESRGTRGHFLLSQIRDFPFRQLLLLAGLRWRYSTPPPHRTDLTWIQSQNYVTTDGPSASPSWSKAPMWGLRPDLYYCQTVAGLLMWSALSDERTGLSFARVTVSSNKSVFSKCNLHFTCY